MSEKEMMKDFMELFPVKGHVVPYIELKFRLASKYGLEELDNILKKMVNKEILNRFEFNNSVHYKAKTEIPVSLSIAGKSAKVPDAKPSTKSSSGGNQLLDLSKLVVSLAESSDDEKVQSLLQDFKSKYDV